MQKLEVGKPFHTDHDNWPEGVLYSFNRGQHSLTIFINEPQESEILAFRNAQVKFSLTTLEGIIFVGAFIPGILAWSDAPFHIKLQSEETWCESTDPKTPETRIMLSLFLVNAASGILEAMRLVTYSPAFSRAFEAAIHDQKVAPFDPATYNRDLGDIQMKMTSPQIVRKAHITCTGGE